MSRHRQKALRAGREGRRCIRLMMWTAVPLLLMLLIGCPPPYQPKKLETQKIGTTENVPTDTPDYAGDGGVVSPNSATAAGGGGAGPCEGGDFDDLADTLKSCDTPMPSSKDYAALKDKLDVKLKPSATSTTPGGRIDIDVTLTNKSSDAVSVYFTGDPFPHFDVEATDAKGRRADLPPQRWPGYPKGFKPEAKEAKASKVTISAGGTAHLKVSWDAVKTKWAPDRAKSWDGRGYPRIPSGPLGKGKYSLKVVLPILGDVDPPKLPIDVSPP